ncbi:hypothetical protein MMC25_003624 [Agyrium rufum]|nr:hypothetical protein [Agyrium rufum]
MVKLDVVRSANAALVRSQPLVAVFIGGTSGIGEYTVQTLAATHGESGQGLRVYIVGRKAAAAEKTIAECLGVCPKGQFKFVQAGDLALLKEVDRVCTEVRRLEEEEESSQGIGVARVDILVITAAYLTWEARRETQEGLDTVMSLLYYARMRFTTQLLPLLLSSVLPSAHVISVYGAGLEGKLFPSDLSLRDPEHYTFTTIRSHVTYMITLFMRQLAAQHPGRLSLTHVFPGLVMTNSFEHDRLPKWLKLVYKWIGEPILRHFSVPARECGDRILFLATERFPAKEDATAAVREKTSLANDDGFVARGSDGQVGSGAYAVGQDGETIPVAKMEKAYARYEKEGLARQVWEHTTKAFADIETGRVFSG